MNKILVGIMMATAIVFSTSIALADGVIIPGSIRVEEFKKLMNERGMDLSGSDDSDGYVENGGNKIKVISYAPVKMEKMELMKEIAFECGFNSESNFVITFKKHTNMSPRQFRNVPF